MADSHSAAGTADAVAHRPATAAALAELQRLEQLARGAGRTDLVDRLGEVRRRVEGDAVPVAVLGEFKQGKSTLVNALLRTDVCPVDPDVGTAIPTVLRFGTPARALGHPVGPADGEPVELDVRGLAETVTERQRGSEHRWSTVEVFLDRTLLSAGLTLIDTPGLGGLESEHGAAALGMLPLAQAALFVTDAGQELTAPELAFVRQIVARCPTVLCVVTKTDLHVDWRQVVELDRQHLAGAGLDVPVLAVSSFLRMHAAARRDRDLQERSGFPALLEALRAQVLRRADALAAASARLDLVFVREQLRSRLAAEREVLRAPAASGHVVASLAEAATRAGALASESATWQLVLSDGVQDMVADVEHDLRQRLLALVRAGEATLDSSDPQAAWPQFEAWLRAEATRAAVANLQVLVERAERLSREVSERFDLDVDTLDVDLPVPAIALGRIAQPRVDFDRSPTRRLMGMLTAARVSYTGAIVGGVAGKYLGLALLGSAGVGAVVLAPLGAATTAVFARRLIRDDRARELELRRQLAKQELRRYLDEVSFVLGKDSRDAVRRTQRYLRDEFTARAALIARTAAESLAAAQRSAALPPERRATRVRQVEEQWRRLAADGDVDAGVDVPTPSERPGGAEHERSA